MDLLNSRSSSSSSISRICSKVRASILSPRSGKLTEPSSLYTRNLLLVWMFYCGAARKTLPVLLHDGRPPFLPYSKSDELFLSSLASRSRSRGGSFGDGVAMAIIWRGGWAACEVDEGWGG